MIKTRPMPVRRALLLIVPLVAALACEKQPEAPHGSPVLLQVAWEVAGAPTIVWSRDPDAAVSTEAPAAGSKIDFIFDRRLDGARVEDTIDGGPSPKANPPITVGWPDMATAMSNPAFAANVFYDSLPNWGPGTTNAFLQPVIPGFPSGTSITFTLDPNGLTSVYGEPMDGPTTVTVMTEPLQVTLPKGTATVPTSYLATIVFSTRAPAAATLMPFIHVSWLGTPLTFDLQNNTGDVKVIYIRPLGCGGAWPAGARVDVTVDAGLPDAFGRTLAAPANGLFTTANIGASAVDGGCGPADGGATDAAPGDGGSDGGVDAGADDAAGDAPANDDADSTDGQSTN